jgi:hypothetical protein
MQTDLLIIFFIYLAVLLCVFAMAFEPNNRMLVTGGTFDISSFLQTIRKKYPQQDNSSAIEVEIKLLHKNLFEKIVEWIREKKYTESNTLNKIWQHDGLISTADSEGNITWSRKKRISKYSLPIGKLTIALEESDICDPTPIGDPVVIRQKRRISTSLNDYWRIDCTWVNDEQIPEIEMEYIAKDYWNAPQHICEIEEFLSLFSK